MKVTRERVNAANVAVMVDMTVGEARKIEARQKSLIRAYGEAALAHIKETEGRDLKAEVPNWTGYEIKATHTPFGSVEVKQYAYDERAPRVLRGSWSVSKKKLIK